MPGESASRLGSGRPSDPWLNGTEHCAVSSDHLDYYLDESTVRFRPPKVGQASSHLKSICLAGAASRCSSRASGRLSNLVILCGWSMDMQ
jgi:hypothetical protein